ncbi:MAG: Zn-dependent hydrolase [Anaerolineaceae bacterium]|nr:Zn-dependent hydrolase [Anaerolineaceae bacterium]
MLQINRERFLSDFEAVSQFGTTEEGGVSRPALSEPDMAAREWLKNQIEAAGLVYSQDTAGNQYGRLVGDDNSRVILTGSHLDSVPDGGRFDGALGVLASLEAIRTIKESGKVPPISIELVNFTDEEGTLLGLMGSRAVIGQISPGEFENPRGGRSHFISSLDRAGLTESGVLNAKRNDITAYLELHIEQGKRLLAGSTEIGVVTAMVGIRSYTLHFYGQAAHAGTTPMNERADALWAATAFIQRAKDHIMANYTPGVVNFGMIEAYPGAFNIVPGEVVLAMEFRHGSDDAMDDMAADLLQLAHEVTNTDHLSLTVENAATIHPAPMNDRVIEAVESACSQLDLSNMRLLSFAGHDAQSIAQVALAGMLFVPSVEGISHNPAEYTAPDDMVNGANVVLHSLLALCDELV